MRRAARTDDNQKEIVSTFRQLGCSVETTHTLGSGFPDIVVGCFGFNLLVEIKDGAKPPSKRKLTPDEERWHQLWTGQIDIVESSDDVLSLVQKYRGVRPQLIEALGA